MPVDPNVLTSNSDTETFDQIMNDYLHTEFDDAAAAAAYLHQRIKDAGIEVRITENGYEVTSAMPDPLRVEARLRNNGITNKSLIRQAILEANTALLDIETFVQDVQATIPATQGAEEATAVAQPQGDPFEILVPQWKPLVPASFTLHQPAQASGSSSASGELIPPEDSASVGANPSTELKPRVLMSMEHKTPTGVIVEINVATAVVSGFARDMSPGYHVAPFESVFEDTDWLLQA